MSRANVILALVCMSVLVGMYVPSVTGSSPAIAPAPAPAPVSATSDASDPSSSSHNLRSANETIKLISPTNNTVINGSAIQGTVAVTNFTLNASAIGKNNTPGEGHYHIFLDGVYKDLSGYDTFNLTRLKAGNHTLKVQLFNNNHSAVVPAVFDEISITVLGQAPSLTIVDPLPNAQVDSASVEVTLNVTFFDLNGSAIGKPNKAGEGHWHVYLNGVLAKMGATMKFDLTNLSAAQYNLRVDLRNNDHTELQPPVFDQITIKILPGRPAIAIKAPADGSSWNSTTVPYSLYLENFVFNESAIGKNNTPGEGHYHIFIDGVYARFGATPTGNLTNLTAGTHAVRFQLHENNHSARDPLVWDTVSMHVYPPGVRITSPANGTKLATNSTSVTYAASNFTLNASAIGKAWSPGEGHVHIMVDGVDTGMSASTTITVKDLADGIRKITVELRNNDHTPLQPIVAHSIWVDVDTTPPPPPAPGVKIDSPANGTKLKTNSTTVSFTVSDFTLNGSAMGGANKPGEGHVHVLVDGNVSGMIATMSFEVKDLKDGTRKITVELVNNDHTSLSPAVSDSVWVEVSASTPGGPSLAILKPVADQKFTTQDVPVEFLVKNLKLVEPKGQANQSGAGHIHLVVDSGNAIWIWNNSPATFVLKLAAGQHTLKGVLVNNDHSAVAGIPEVSVTITVEGGQKPAPDNTGLFVGIGLLILLILTGLLLLLLRRRKKDQPEKEKEEEGHDAKESGDLKDESGPAAEKDASAGKETAPKGKDGK